MPLFPYCTPWGELAPIELDDLAPELRHDIVHTLEELTERLSFPAESLDSDCSLA